MNTKINTYIVLIFTFIFISKTNAQFPTDNTPYQSIVAVTPALPAVLTPIEDTTVPDPITITRITDYVPAWSWYPIHEYAKVQPWNADASIYKLYTVAIYDANTHQMIRTLPGGNIAPSYWSNTNADLIYSFRVNGDILTYSVANDSYQTIDHIQNSLGQDYQTVKLGPGEGNIDKNDTFVALIGRTGSDMDVIIYNLQTLQVMHRQTFIGAWGIGSADPNNDVPDYIDWVSVSQSGNYVGLMWNHNTTSQANPHNTHYGVEIYNTTNMAFLRRIVEYGNHGDFGFATNGDEVFVQFWGPTGTVNMYYLDRMERLVLTSHDNFAGEGHISCRNLNRPGWAIVSQDENARTGQMIAMKLDNSGTVEYFGHHFSSSSTYNKSPMPVPTPNGDKIMFKSDFGNAANASEVYSFEAIVSSALSTPNNSENIYNIYPNPTKNLINIKGKEPINQVNIYNTIGQIVKTVSNINSNTATINIQLLKEGVYILKVINTNHKGYNKMFIKML